MGLCQFLSGLFEDGRVSVPAVGPLSEGEVREADRLLRETERRYRLELPAEAPAFEIAAARWAATRFYRACQFAVYRDVPEKLLDRELDDLSCKHVSPETHYSVDIVFGYLPDLVNFAATAAERDPLVGHLRRWARLWPLSSVGIRGLEDVSIDDFAHCPSLMQLYADRIIAKEDASRLSDPRARQAVRSAVGMYPELAGVIGRQLRPTGEQVPWISSFEKGIVTDE
jgi:hypothetical protein